MKLASLCQGIFLMNSKIVFRSLVLISAFSLWHNASNAFAASSAGQTFATPREAVAALGKAAAANSLKELRAIFGPEFSEIANPDLVQATNEVTAFAAAFRESNKLMAAGEKRMVLQFGRDNTEFPVPLIESSGRWLFDTKAGVEELINRRVGRNELDVLEVARTYVQAQREYAARDRDNDEVLEYAQNFHSAPGTKNGLFWSPDLDGSMSPLGPFMAEAEAAGYRKRAERQPFHGYYFRILTRQGKHAPGGAYEYTINKNMIGGFALVAWPAEYQVTGVMTFIVNQQGRVFQKDLGARGSELANSMKAYDPDRTWSPSPD
jgi:hypothetical protein